MRYYYRDSRWIYLDQMGKFFTRRIDEFEQAAVILECFKIEHEFETRGHAKMFVYNFIKKFIEPNFHFVIRIRRRRGKFMFQKIENISVEGVNEIINMKT